MQVLLLFALGVAIAAVWFALQNPEPVVVRFLGWQFGGSLALVLLGTFGLGFMVSILVSMPTLVKRYQRLRALERKIRELERQRPPPQEQP